MGYARAIGMRAVLEEDAALYDHLVHNHYPPIHPMFIRTAKAALCAVREGNYAENIMMANGQTRPAGEIVEDMHLEAFLEEMPLEDDGEGW